MDKITQPEFLESELEKLISKLKSDRDRHKRNALNLILATAMLAAIATVLLGWQNALFPELLKNVALVLNVSIGVFAAYDAFFEPRKLWIRETIAFSKLKDVQRDLRFDLAKDQALSDDKLVIYKATLDKILNASLDDWIKDKSNS